MKEDTPSTSVNLRVGERVSNAEDIPKEMAPFCSKQNSFWLVAEDGDGESWFWSFKVRLFRFLISKVKSIFFEATLGVQFGKLNFMLYRLNVCEKDYHRFTTF